MPWKEKHALFQRLFLDRYSSLSAHPCYQAPLWSLFFPHFFCVSFSQPGRCMGECTLPALCLFRPPFSQHKLLVVPWWYLSCSDDVQSYLWTSAEPSHIDANAELRELKKKKRCVSRASPPATTWSRLTSAQVKNWRGCVRGTARSEELREVVSVVPRADLLLPPSPLG